MTGPALKVFFNIASLWKLSRKEAMSLLGISHPSIFYRWRKSPDTCLLRRDSLERISHIISIYKALQVLLPNTDSSDNWIRKPNKAAIFVSCSALDRMLAGNVSDLFFVSRYLETQI